MLIEAPESFLKGINKQSVIDPFEYLKQIIYLWIKLISIGYDKTQFFKKLQTPV